MKITEDRISEFANRSIECSQSEQRGKNRLKKKDEQSLRISGTITKKKKNQILVSLEFQEENCGI